MTRGSVILMPAGANLLESGADALVNPVDAVTGAQGKGLALAFRRRWPAAAALYQGVARTGQMAPGATWCARVWFEYRMVDIIFAATKRHWREPSTLAHVEACLTSIRHDVVRLGVRTVALPALGCGCGGLAWDDVRPLILTAAELMAEGGVTVEVYAPHEERRAR